MDENYCTSTTQNRMNRHRSDRHWHWYSHYCATFQKLMWSTFIWISVSKGDLFELIDFVSDLEIGFIYYFISTILNIDKVSACHTQLLQFECHFVMSRSRKGKPVQPIRPIRPQRRSMNGYWLTIDFISWIFTISTLGTLFSWIFLNILGFSCIFLYFPNLIGFSIWQYPPVWHKFTIITNLGRCEPIRHSRIFVVPSNVPL